MIVVTSLKVAPVLVPTIKTLSMIDEEVHDDRSGEVNDEEESEDSDDENLELAARPREALASEVMQRIPASRKSTRLSVATEKFVAPQPNPRKTNITKSTFLMAYMNLRGEECKGDLSRT